MIKAPKQLPEQQLKLEDINTSLYSLRFFGHKFSWYGPPRSPGLALLDRPHCPPSHDHHDHSPLSQGFCMSGSWLDNRIRIVAKHPSRSLPNEGREKGRKKHSSQFRPDQSASPVADLRDCVELRDHQRVPRSSKDHPPASSDPVERDVSASRALSPPPLYAPRSLPSPITSTAPQKIAACPPANAPTARTRLPRKTTGVLRPPVRPAPLEEPHATTWKWSQPGVEAYTVRSAGFPLEDLDRVDLEVGYIHRRCAHTHRHTHHDKQKQLQHHKAGC